MDEKIKDKIRKLLALSHGTDSDNESYVALQKAQALMAEYKLSEKDIKPEEASKKCIHKRTNFSYTYRSSDYYLNELAEIIAENFCCINYISKAKKKQRCTVYFMGKEEDVSIAEEALNIANFAIIHGYNKVWKSMCEMYGIDYIPAKLFNPAKLGYIKGYMEGLKEALRTQREENQEWGLVLVAPKEALEFYNSLHEMNINFSTPRVSGSYYNEGYTDGRSFNMHKKISSDDKLKLQ